MKRTVDEILQKIREVVVDDTSDKVIELIEDVKDTYVDVDTSEYERKYKELDNAWRRKYVDRFYSETTEDVDDSDVEGVKEVDETIKERKYEDLFKEEK